MSMNHTVHFLLGITILAWCTIGDYITTIESWHLGLGELNPLVPIVGLLPLKLLAFVLFGIQYAYLYHRIPSFHKTYLAPILMALWSAPLINNTMWILFRIAESTS